MRLSRILKMVSVVALLLLLAAPVSAQEGEGDEGDAAAGAALYAENCVVCHGEQGEGRAGASLNRVYGGINPDAFLRETIRRGVQGTYMPPWGEEYGGPLTTAEIEDIAAYIESWGTTVEPPLPAPRPPAQDIPPVPEVDGDPNAGAAVYQTNCVACHGENGEGRVGAALLSVTEEPDELGEPDEDSEYQNHRQECLSAHPLLASPTLAARLPRDSGCVVLVPDEHDEPPPPSGSSIRPCAASITDIPAPCAAKSPAIRRLADREQIPIVAIMYRPGPGSGLGCRSSRSPR